DIFGGRIRDPRDHIAGGGIADIEHLAGTGLDLAAVDEIAVDFDGGHGWLGGNIQTSLPSTMTALRLSAGSTRFSVWLMCVLMMRAAALPSRRCIASIRATCSATSCVGSWPRTLATLTRTRR